MGITKGILAVLLGVAVMAIPSLAQARQHHHRAAVGQLDPGCNVIFPCTPMAGQTVRGRGLFDGIRSIRLTMHRDRTAHRRPPVARHVASYGVPSPSVRGTVAHAVEVIGGRPSGCPYAFCGCEASLYLFHKIVPALNLAYNWVVKFPRAAPAPGRAAARRGHVMVLVEHVDGDLWVVHDGNSGGHLTRRHVRSIAGYTVVDPSGGA